MSARKLIVTADDFGLTERVNEAIRHAHQKGIVTSASLMANGRAFESAAAIAHAEPGLDCGLHLNLTEGPSVADASTIPSLANMDGFIYHHPADLWIALWTGRVQTADIERETRAQLGKAVTAGVDISHIDGHKHVHAVRPVLEAVLRVASEFGVKAIRSTTEAAPELLSVLRRNMAAASGVVKQYVSARVLSALHRASARTLSRHGVITPSRFYGVTQTGFLDFDVVATVIRRLPAGVSELMCHPGYVDADLKATPTRLLSQRESELGLLTSSKLRQLIEIENVQLVGYKDLVRDYGTSDSRTILHRRSAV